MEETVALINQFITENATTAHDPDEYDQRYQQLEQRYQQQEKEHQKVSDQIADLTTRRAKAAAVRDYLATQPPLEYSDEAGNILMQYSCVTKEGLIQVVLAN